jgi:hypothetical protein
MDKYHTIGFDYVLTIVPLPERSVFSIAKPRKRKIKGVVRVLCFHFSYFILVITSTYIAKKTTNTLIGSTTYEGSKVNA